jgi:hypothetical protein
MAGVHDTFEDFSYEPLAVRGERCALLRFSMATDGFDVSGLVVVVIDDEQRICIQDVFDESDRARAVQELDRRYRDTEGDTPNSVLADEPAEASVRALAGYEAAFAARDWDWFTGAIHPEIVSEDRRTGIGFGTATGRDALLALTRGLADVGFETVENTPLAVRGEHVLLTRRTFRTSTGFDLQLIALLESDDEGRLIRHVQWDPEDLTAAVAELEERAAALAAVRQTESGPDA